MQRGAAWCSVRACISTVRPGCVVLTRMDKAVVTAAVVALVVVAGFRAAEEVCVRRFRKDPWFFIPVKAATATGAA